MPWEPEESTTPGEPWSTLSIDLLRPTPGRCTSQQQAEAPGSWFEQVRSFTAAKYRLVVHFHRLRVA
jgi:hypothetical protein